jgi:hypothetical protein
MFNRRGAIPVLRWAYYLLDEDEDFTPPCIQV